MAMRRSASQWLKLVKSWKRSGETATEFGARLRVKPTDLHSWHWRLRKAGLLKDEQETPKRARLVQMRRVERSSMICRGTNLRGEGFKLLNRKIRAKGVLPGPCAIRVPPSGDALPFERQHDVEHALGRKPQMRGSCKGVMLQTLDGHRPKRTGACDDDDHCGIGSSHSAK